MSRVILITGASSGLGAGLARRFAATGDRIALLARRAERLEELAAEVRTAGGAALPVPCDVTDRESVHAAVERCAAELGPVDLLIANAGVVRFVPARRFDAEVLREIFQVNLFGASYCIEAVLPSMLRRRSGHIVGISSLSARHGVPGMGAYSASKAALTNLLEAMRVELRPHGVDVTTVHPGFVRTDMIGGSADHLPFVMELDDAVERIHVAIQRRDPDASFPWQTSAFMRVGQLLPERVADRLFAALEARNRRPSTP